MTDAGSPEAGAPFAGRYRALTPWSPLGALAATGLIMVSAFALATLLVLGTGLIGLEHLESAGADGTGTLGKMVGPLLIWMVTSQVLMIAFTLAAARWFGGRPVDVLALRPPQAGVSAYVSAFLLVVLVLGVYNTAVYALFRESMLGDLKPFMEMMQSPYWWLAALVIVVGAPLSEELLFRGFLFPALVKSRFGFSGATVVTTTSWTLLHLGYSLAGLFEVFLVGLVLTGLLWRSGSLRVPILCHGLYNGIVLLLIVWLRLGG